MAFQDLHGPRPSLCVQCLLSWLPLNSLFTLGPFPGLQSSLYLFSLTPALIWPLTTYIRNPSLGRDPFPCTISCSFFVHPDSPSPPQAPQSWLQAQGGQVFHSSHPPTTMPNVLANTTICKSLNTILSCYSTRAVCPPHTELHYFISVAPAQGSLRSNRGQNS